MTPPPDDRRPPLTPQLAVRIAVMGGVALTMFAIVFFRLWVLQVLSGDQYLAQARGNRTRNVLIAAPRGEIVDRSGNLLVDSVRALAVQISPTALPVALKQSPPGQPSPPPPGRDAAVYTRLARVLGVSTRRGPCKVAGHGVAQLSPIACQVAQQYAQLSYADVTVKTDVPAAVQYYIAERQEQFPGVSVGPIYLRRYPLKTVAAQLFGTIGPISCNSPHSAKTCELKQSHFRGVPKNAVVGQAGLEYTYDHYLRGKDGAQTIQVDASGQPKGPVSQTSPTPGYNLKLSLDLSLQKAGEQALSQAIANNPPAAAGAFLALNPDSGEVLAMGSAPTFDPNVFTKPIPQAKFDAQFRSPTSGNPLLNRAIDAEYPTGSTFKGITATAALQSGDWSLGQTYDDSGLYMNGAGDLRHNAGNASYGVLDITQAIKFSSDDFFYNLGRLMNLPPAKYPQGGPLQQWARAYGIGRPTGIDLGPQYAGILPTPAWRARNNARELAYEHKHQKGCCTLGDLRPWSVGDNENLAVGQGDLEATPLQLGVAYAAIANGGTVVRPHLGLEVDDPDGTPLRPINPPPTRHIDIAPQNLDAIRQGLRLAASSPGGTSADVFAGFPQQVYGKTGTAQHNGQADQSWYVCFVPSSATSKPILVVVTVEQGGFGAAAAAPAARQILSQWFYGKPGPVVVGGSKTL